MRLTIIRISSIEEQISAPKSRVFEFMTDFDSKTDDSKPHSTVLSREENRLLVEFKTAVPILLGLHKSYRTVEEVILHKPESIEFREIEGPFAMRQEHIVLSEQPDVTQIQYEAQFRVKGWIFGWLFGLLFVRPMLNKAAKKHLKQIKSTIELQV